MTKLTLPRRTYGDKAAGSKLIHLTPGAMEALQALSFDRLETATACFAIEVLYAITSDDDDLLDLILQRLFIALPDLIAIEQLYNNLEAMTFTVERLLHLARLSEQIQPSGERAAVRQDEAKGESER